MSGFILNLPEDPFSLGLESGCPRGKSLTPETALVAAKAALEACRKQGYQVGVAVVDRAGITQVFLRDRFADPPPGQPLPRRTRALPA